jgi:lipopolysaccharide/colanic/teichoic acid biosynthesis glycosyltransferase
MPIFGHIHEGGGRIPYPVQRAVSQRILDILAAAAGLLLLSPVLLLIGLAVKLGDGGPVLYISKRVGRGGRLFSIYKFRSMVEGAERISGGLTLRGDRRVTRAGRVLRAYKLDELPQLVNVLKGDMSLVGPRPEDPGFVARYTPEQREILRYRPGITSPASLHYRNEEEFLGGGDTETLYIEKILPHKLSMDLAYLTRRTVGSDLVVILRTLGGIR